MQLILTGELRDEHAMALRGRFDLRAGPAGWCAYGRWAEPRTAVEQLAADHHYILKLDGLGAFLVRLAGTRAGVTSRFVGIGEAPAALLEDAV